MHVLLFVILISYLLSPILSLAMSNINIDELYSENGIKVKSFSLPISTSITSDIKSKTVTERKKNSFHFNSYKIFNIIKTALLPVGYPNTVPPEYIDYQKSST